VNGIEENGESLKEPSAVDDATVTVITGDTVPTDPVAKFPVRANCLAPTPRLPTAPVAETPEIGRPYTTLPTAPVAEFPVSATLMVGDNVPTAPVADTPDIATE
jgi:hypothetical protein